MLPQSLPLLYHPCGPVQASGSFHHFFRRLCCHALLMPLGGRSRVDKAVPPCIVM